MPSASWNGGVALDKEEAELEYVRSLHRGDRYESRRAGNVEAPSYS
jgi:hypothetical protein